ncbi:MAG: T9SS type A sorting domain-containing protein, partial [bacterium]|nr:T9SS type A sorting domain-containing protein [bacterium]
ANVWTITWGSTGSISTVAIDYSVNGGSTWNAITSSTTNDGSYGWTVPSSATTQGRVRVTGGTAQDTSDGNFTIDVPSGGDYATVPYTTGFEGGSVDQYWTTASNANGRIQVTTANTPHSGSYHLTMDCSSNGTYSTNEGWLHVDLSGLSQVDLDFWWKDFSDETHTADGVYFSDDGGSSFTKVQDLNGASYTNNVWREWNLDVDALASANGLSLTGTFVVKFQQYDNYMATTDGMAFDDVSVTEGGGSGGTAITAETEPNADSGTANGPVGEGVAVTGAIASSSDDDWYWFDVTTSGTISISVAIGGSADLDWFLYDSSVTQVDRGYTTSNPEAGTYAASPGRYYLRVDGYNGATSSYTLTVSGGLGASDSGVEKQDVPLVWSLKGNEPNPFNPSTKISYDVPRTSTVQLRIYNTRGQLVRVLVDETVTAGRQTAIWDGRDSAGRQVTSGVYLYVVESEDFRAARKMTLVK